MSSPGTFPAGPDPTSRTRWHDSNTLRTIATAMLIVALSFWLLERLAVVLRPLLLAVLVAYVLLPYHNRLRKVVPAPVSVVLIAGCVAVVLAVVGFVVYASLGELQVEMPSLQARAAKMTRGARVWLSEHAPWVTGTKGEGADPSAGIDDIAQTGAKLVVNAAAGATIEALTAGLYLLFLLLGAGKLGTRVRGAYDSENAERILDVFGRINSAIIAYLKAKVIASLILAAVAGVVLGACGVRFALLWAVLTFLCNFIPYVGTVIAYSIPIGFAAISSDLNWQFFLAAGLLLAAHALCASVIEPMILGKAVGLSPIIILAALALWGSIWGLPGMLMAVPLTVVILIVLENIEATRSIAKLLEGT